MTAAEPPPTDPPRPDWERFGLEDMTDEELVDNVAASVIAQESTSELVNRAEDALVGYLVARSQARAGCCGAGQLCPYHQGYQDGLEELLEVQRRTWAMGTRPWGVDDA